MTTVVAQLPLAKDGGAATDPASQCVIATANVMRQLHESSPCESLERVPRDLSARLPNIRNTGVLLHQMPSVVISLDTHLDSAIRSAGLLENVKSMLHGSEDQQPAFLDPERPRYGT